jgi:hypothetical protein
MLTKNYRHTYPSLTYSMWKIPYIL